MTETFKKYDLVICINSKNTDLKHNQEYKVRKYNHPNEILIEPMILIKGYKDYYRADRFRLIKRT